VMSACVLEMVAPVANMIEAALAWWGQADGAPRPTALARCAAKTHKPIKERTLMLRGESKITTSHLRRLAIIYVRQSTLAQVRATPSRQPASTASLAMRPGWGGRRRPSRSSTPTSGSPGAVPTTGPGSKR